MQAQAFGKRRGKTTNKEEDKYDYYYRQKKPNGGVIRQHATRLRILFLIMVFLFWALLAIYFVRIEDHRPESIHYSQEWKGTEDTLKSCTYEQVEAAFGKTSRQHGEKASAFLPLPREEKCWSLTDRILQIPKTAILNFDSLIPIGSGNKSGVFMAFLNLSNIGQQPCKVVYKTDLAHTNLCDKRLEASLFE